MTLLYALAQLVETLAVLQLDLGPSPEVVLQFLDDCHLGLYSQVEASQLFVQLLPDVCADGDGREEGSAH